MSQEILEEDNAIIVEPAGGKVEATVIWLHGLGADGEDFRPIIGALELPEAHSIRFIFPHAPYRAISINGGQIMRGWYDIRQPDFESELDLEGIQESVETLCDLIKQEVAKGIASHNILLAGFSQGGAIALYGGLRYPEKLAGILALSTYLPHAVAIETEASANNHELPIFMAHGSADLVVPIDLAKQCHDRLQAMGYLLEWHRYPMGHNVIHEETTDIGRWIRERLC